MLWAELLEKVNLTCSLAKAAFKAEREPVNSCESASVPWGGVNVTEAAGEENTADPVWVVETVTAKEVEEAVEASV